MKTILYRVLNYLRYTLCGTCDRGLEWEHDRTLTLCYCTHDSWSNLVRQYTKRKMRRKDEPIF